MRVTHPQSHVTLRLCDHVTNQKYFIFTWRKAYKAQGNAQGLQVNKVVTRMRRSHPCHVTPRPHGHVTTIQLVEYICSTLVEALSLKQIDFK